MDSRIGNLSFIDDETGKIEVIGVAELGYYEDLEYYYFYDIDGDMWTVSDDSTEFMDDNIGRIIEELLERGYAILPELHAAMTDSTERLEIDHTCVGFIRLYSDDLECDMTTGVVELRYNIDDDSYAIYDTLGNLWLVTDYSKDKFEKDLDAMVKELFEKHYCNFPDIHVVSADDADDDEVAD